jgi:hypothetical protein
MYSYWAKAFVSTSSVTSPPTPPPHCRHLISIFNDHELELLISGLPDIDVDDLRANTEYQGFSPQATVIRWVRAEGGGRGGDS